MSVNSNKMSEEEFKDWIKDSFEGKIKLNPETSDGIAAMEILMNIIKDINFKTIIELQEKLRTATVVMEKSDHPVAAITSSCELFMRFITLASLEPRDVEECRETMLRRGDQFIKKLKCSNEAISKSFLQFIVDGSKILTHSRSRVVLQALKYAADNKRRFHVYITKSADNSGEQMANDLKKIGVSCRIISDSAVGSVLENVDFVMVGAEGVAESGGIVNKLGTYMIAICALTMKKPFYVLTESFKFSRLYPLSQNDLPKKYKYTPKMVAKMEKSGREIDPLVDYTPPTYIKLLFTDLGILTPSAVSDELIKLYL